MEGSITFYETEAGKPLIEVKLSGETLWLSQRLMAEAFDKDADTIGLHIKNIFAEGELSEIESTTIFSIIQKEGDRLVNRGVKFYNLDVILSVGYRVNSKKGTQFRIWANKILKEHLVSGYTLNEKRLKEQSRQLEDLKQTVKLLGNVIENKTLNNDEAEGLIRVITDYAYALDLLDRYDHKTLEIGATTTEEIFKISYEEAVTAIRSLREKFGGSKLFGNEKDESFQSSLLSIYQTFDGRDLYPSVEEKAAQLLYFVVKNHSFSDGNKRIAAFLFVWFMEKNGILYRHDGFKRIADNALVALTLMMAESKPGEKEIMTKLVVNLINAKN